LRDVCVARAIEHTARLFAGWHVGVHSTVLYLDGERGVGRCSKNRTANREEQARGYAYGGPKRAERSRGRGVTAIIQVGHEGLFITERSEERAHTAGRSSQSETPPSKKKRPSVRVMS
jgi:hypothetical protein